METVIRSPQKGVIAKLVHQAGDICKAGTALVLFEEVCYPLPQSSKCCAEANFYKDRNLSPTLDRLIYALMIQGRKNKYWR